MNFLSELSRLMYEWMFDTLGDPYQMVWENVEDGPYGMKWVLTFLLCIGLLVAGIYYFVIAKNASNDTRKNYLLIVALGYVAFVVCTIVGLPTAIGSVTTSDILNFELLKVLLLSGVLYYPIWIEIVSLFFKAITKSNTDLLSSLLNVHF